MIAYLLLSRIGFKLSAFSNDYLKINSYTQEITPARDTIAIFISLPIGNLKYKTTVIKEENKSRPLMVDTRINI